MVDCSSIASAAVAAAVAAVVVAWVVVGASLLAAVGVEAVVAAVVEVAASVSAVGLVLPQFLFFKSQFDKEINFRFKSDILMFTVRFGKILNDIISFVC